MTGCRQPDDLSLWELACPSCRTILGRPVNVTRCGFCGTTFRQVGGIWRFLPEARASAFATFLHAYQTVRTAEGWGASEVDYYRALPHVAPNDPLVATWRIRERTFDQFIGRVVRPLTDRRVRPLRILDVGAGNGWLSYQLARRGHDVAAIDLSIDDRDGLGALVRYGIAPSDVAEPSRDLPGAPRSTRASGPGDQGRLGRVLLMQAEFDCLPLASAQVDLVIFNAALHYSSNEFTTMSEALRVLRADGSLVILDSPVYRDPASGRQMLRDRDASFEKVYGIRATAIRADGFLTYHRLVALATALNLDLVVRDSVPRWRSLVRALKTRVRGHREPAGFPLILLRRT